VSLPKPRSQTRRVPQRRLSPEELEALLGGYENGTPINELADLFGIHR